MKFAIYHSFICSIHESIFGYIMQYCKNNNYLLTIYYPTPFDNFNWKDFYNTKFPNIEWKDIHLFHFEYTIYDYIFLTTDDDKSYSDIYNIKNNVICIDHTHIIRRPSIDLFYHFALRPLSINYKKWALPCYETVNPIEKKMALLENNNEINVVILGGNNNYNLSIINRLTSSSKITLHIISREVNNELIHLLNKFTVKIYESISTMHMMIILKYSKYILADITTHPGHIAGLTMASSIPEAFCNLNKLIISSKNNNLYKFKSALVFDIDSNENIEVDNKIEDDDIIQIYNERTELIKQFDNHMKTIIEHNQTA